MKKTLIALAAVAVSGAVFAQSTVTINGGMRIGYGQNATGVKALSTNQGSGNTINFRVNEDLGGGMSFLGAVQFRFDSVNGNNNAAGAVPAAGASANGRLLQTTSIGVRGGFGTVEAGRIGLTGQWAYNAFGSTSAGVALSADAARGGATEDGQLRYTSPNLNGFSVSLSNTDKTSGKAGQQIRAAYAQGPISAAFIKERTAAGAETQSIGASYDLGVARVMIVNSDNKPGKATTFGVTAPMGAITLKAAMKNGKGAVADATAVGINYALSKRTVVEANSWKTKGEAKQSYWVGVRHSF